MQRVSGNGRLILEMCSVFVDGGDPGPVCEEVPVGPVGILEGLKNLGMDLREPDDLRIPLPEGKEIRRATVAQTLLSRGVTVDL